MELIPVYQNTYCLMGRTAIGVYKTDDTHCVLIDNGYTSEYDELVDTLKQAGLTPSGLIVTHAHLDHHGNSKRLREEFHIPLAMSLGEAALISSKAALDRYTNYFGRSEDEKYSIDHSQICPVDEIIMPEQTDLTLAGAVFSVFHLPGHSFDHLAVATPDGVLHGGDILLTDHALQYVKLPYCDHVALDLASKEAIASLPYRRFIFSHKGYVEGSLEELAKRNCDLVRLRIGELASLLETPMTREEFYQAARSFLSMHIGTYDQLVRQERHLRPYLEELVTSGAAFMEVKNSTIYFSGKQAQS